MHISGKKCVRDVLLLSSQQWACKQKRILVWTEFIQKWLNRNSAQQHDDKFLFGICFSNVKSWKKSALFSYLKITKGKSWPWRGANNWSDAGKHVEPKQHGLPDSTMTWFYLLQKSLNSLRLMAKRHELALFSQEFCLLWIFRLQAAWGNTWQRKERRWIYDWVDWVHGGFH